MYLDESPAYVKAADAHNIASSATSAFTDVLGALGRAPDFIGVSIASGLNSFYNTGIAINNFTRDEDAQLEERDTAEWVASYDDDLGKYYTENKEAADLTGFIAGSFLPGLGAVKGLRAGQSALVAASSGQVGSNLSLATRLLVPSMENYVKREAGELATRSASFSFMHQNSLKALGAGTYQGILEATAFEIGVAATMFRSPILSEMDTDDLIKNMGMGIVFGGAFSAIGSAAGTYFGVKNLLNNASSREIKVAGSSQLGSSASATKFADAIVTKNEDMIRLAVPVTEESVLAQKLAQGETGYSISPEALKGETLRLNHLREANLRKLQNERRTDIHALAPKDQEFTNFVADIVDKADVKSATGLFANMKQMVRGRVVTGLDSKIRDMVKTGTAKTKDDATKLAAEEETSLFVRLHSGKIGETSTKTSGYMRLADRYDSKQIHDKLVKHKASVAQAPDFRTITNAEEAELRWLKVSQQPQPLSEDSIISMFDLPYMQHAVDSKIGKIKIKKDDQIIEVASNAELKQYLAEAKQAVVDSQIKKKRGTGFVELVSDVRRDALEGAYKGDAAEAMFATRTYAKELSDYLGREVTEKELRTLPTTAKATYDTSNVLDDAGMVMEGMALIKYREKLAKESTDRAFATIAKDLAGLFPEIPEDLLRKATRTGTGAGFATNAGAGYGTLEEITSYIGNLTAELSKKRMEILNQELEPLARQLASSPEDAIAFSSINEIMSGTTERYVLNEAGDALIPRKVREYEKALLAGEEPPMYTLQQGAPEEVAINSDLLRDVVQAHINKNGNRNQEWGVLNATQGLEDTKHLDVFYPFRPNPRDYKFVAFVKDDTITGVGHTKMLFAHSSRELDAQIALVPPQYRVFTKGEAEEYYNARGEWMYDKTLHDNYIDADMQTKGVSSRLFPMSDPVKIANTWVADHVAKENTLVKQSVLMKYEKETNELKRLGELYTNTSSSFTGQKTLLDQLTSSDKNPYLSQVKAMLNITKTDEIPLLVTANQALDRIASQVYQSVEDVLGRGGRAVTDEQIDTINNIMDQYGVRSGYYDAATHMLANANIPRGTLSKFVRSSNSFLTSTVLKLDFFNSLNNLVGNTVLFSAEIKSVTQAIEKGSVEGAGELAKLMKMNVPGVEGDLITSPSKLIANAFSRIHGENSAELIAEYKKRGFVPDLTDQFFKALDPMTLGASETVSTLSKRTEQIKEGWGKFVEKGEKVTGNKFAEQFNRLIAADVMKQITEVAVKHGVLDDRAAWAYVNTFTNRVNGVTRAAERPLMFQGPIGQAVGLFQSYQFNLMQQMFRYIGEGKVKIAAMAMGLQGTIYGAGSLPGFSAINNTLIGNAYGNEGHRDLYDAANTVLGKAGAEWLMYGAPSNLLKASLFTRGDTNPRTWSIVPNPTNPSELPIFSAYAKAFGSMKDTLKNVQGGAPIWNSFLSGIEHMGLSRPLAGMAAVARGFTNQDGQVTSTQRDGSILGQNDMVSWASLVRVAGAKPIDDAVLSNNYFRINAYAQKDREKRLSIATQIKLNLQGGGTVEPDQIVEFAERYVAAGGKQTQFNQFWMQQYKNVDTSKAEQMANALNNPYGQSLQRLMGGRSNLSELD